MYSKEFAEMWDSLPAKIADRTESGRRPEAIKKASELIYPDRTNVTVVEASLKDIQVSRGDSGIVGKALGIKPKTTHFKLETSMGYKSIQDLRIVHAKDYIPPLKIGVTESQESIRERTIKQFNPYTLRSTLTVALR